MGLFTVLFAVHYSFARGLTDVRGLLLQMTEGENVLEETIVLAVGSTIPKEVTHQSFHSISSLALYLNSCFHMLHSAGMLSTAVAFFPPSLFF